MKRALDRASLAPTKSPSASVSARNSFSVSSLSAVRSLIRWTTVVFPRCASSWSPPETRACVAVPLFGLVGQPLRYYRQRVTLEVVLVAQFVEDAPGLRPFVEWIEHDVAGKIERERKRRSDPR